MDWNYNYTASISNQQSETAIPLSQQFTNSQTKPNGKLGITKKAWVNNQQWKITLQSL